MGARVEFPLKYKGKSTFVRGELAGRQGYVMTRPLLAGEFIAWLAEARDLRAGSHDEGIRVH